MKKHLIIIIAVFLGGFSAYSQCNQVMDLSSWIQEGNPANGNWTVQPGDTSVYQSINGQPTYFVTPFNLIDLGI